MSTFESEPINIEDSNDSSEYDLIDELEKDLLKIFTYIVKEKVKLGTNSIGNLFFIYSDFPMDVVIYNNIEYILFNESRIIKFYTKNEKKLIYKESHFIYNPDYFKKVLEKLNVYNFIVICENANLDDSNTSIDDYNSAFCDTSVKNILIYTVSNILTEKNLGMKLIKDLAFSNYKIKQLSLNSQKYFPDSYEHFFMKSKIISEHIKNLAKFAISNSVIDVLYLLGTKGCSKSTLLLLFVQTILKLKPHFGCMYFNVNYLKTLSLTETKKNLLKEALYLVSDIRELDKFKLFHPFKNIGKISEPINTVKYFIQEIIKYYKDIFNEGKIILFIIDNFHINGEKEIICLKDIINESRTCRYNIKIIISGTGNYFNEKIRNHFLNKLNGFESLIYMNNYNFNFQNIDNKEIQNCPLFYFLYEPKKEKYADFKVRMIIKEKEYLKKYNFNILYYSLDINKLSIPLEDLETFNIYDSLPDYFYIINHENTVRFEISNQIFLEAIQETIQFMVQNNIYKNVIIEKKLPESACGFAEEYLITLLFKYNKFKVKNLDTFKHIENVPQIYNFRKETLFNYNKIYPGNILITQNFNGKNYDLLAIINIKGIDYGIFIQIGVDKNEFQITTIKNDIKINHKNYINNLNKTYKKNIKYITLFFIFDEKNQESKIHKIGEKSCGSKICENMDIDYLWYSLENNELYMIKYEQKIFRKKISLTEYVPTRFLLGVEDKNKNALNNNEIDVDFNINPIYTLNQEQESIINNIVLKIYKGQYEFSSMLGKSFQILFPIDSIGDMILKIKKTEIPNIHIFSTKNNDEIYSIINNNFYKINKDLQLCNKFEVNFQYVSWDIYKLKIKKI